jgi:hypothetical protein
MAIEAGGIEHSMKHHEGDAKNLGGGVTGRIALDRAFRFDADESQWYKRLRESGAQDALGRIGDDELIAERVREEDDFDG